MNRTVMRSIQAALARTDMELKLGADGNPVIDQLSEEGFVDHMLRITDLVDDDTNYCFHWCRGNSRFPLQMPLV